MLFTVDVRESFYRGWQEQNGTEVQIGTFLNSRVCKTRDVCFPKFGNTVKAGNCLKIVFP
jgi:hypothetical protein